MTIADLSRTTPAGAGPSRRALDRVFPDRRNGALARWAFRGVLALFVVLILASYAVPLFYQLRGDRLLVVTSGSMAPEIQAGDAVVIHQVTSASQLRVGQVVTFYPVGGTQLITHRITDLVTLVRRDTETDEPVLDQEGNPKQDPWIKTKGDANDTPDPDLTPATQVRGIVLEVHTALGYPLGWAHAPLGRLLLFGPPLLMLLGAEVLSRLPAHVRGRGRLWGAAPHYPEAATAPTSAEADPAGKRDDAPALV